MPYRDDDDPRELRSRRAELTAELLDVEHRIDEQRQRTKLPLLAEVEIASPCAARWDDMIGDERVRRCGVCARDVFDLSALRAEEAEQLLREHGASGDGPCLRLSRRSDGTVLTADCPAGRRAAMLARLRARGRAAAVKGTGVVLAATAVVAPILGGVALAVEPILGRSRMRQASSDAMTVRSAAEMYLAEDPQADCPTVKRLVESGILNAAAREADPFGHPFEISCVGRDVVVTSAALREDLKE